MSRHGFQENTTVGVIKALMLAHHTEGALINKAQDLRRQDGEGNLIGCLVLQLLGHNPDCAYAGDGQETSAITETQYRDLVRQAWDNGGEPSGVFLDEGRITGFTSPDPREPTKEQMQAAKNRLGAHLDAVGIPKRIVINDPNGGRK